VRDVALATAVAGVATLVIVVPIGWKWQLGVWRVTLFCAMGVVASGAIATGLSLIWDASASVLALIIWLFTLGLALAALLFRFYRDPERAPPKRDDIVVSPADGTVLYIRRVNAGLLPFSTKVGRAYALDELSKTPLHLSDATVVGIGLNFLDVHVNRAPIKGTVVDCRRHAGDFQSLRRLDAVFDNERATVVIRGLHFQVASVLIASRMVRRIVLFIRNGQCLELGERIGMIRFGSQVDLILPSTLELSPTLAVGARLVGGESIVAHVRPTGSHAGLGVQPVLEYELGRE
jgi:phosphatidylserine decarboxylase